MRQGESLRMVLWRISQKANSYTLPWGLTWLLCIQTTLKDFGYIGLQLKMEGWYTDHLVIKPSFVRQVRHESEVELILE